MPVREREKHEQLADEAPPKRAEEWAICSGCLRERAGRGRGNGAAPRVGASPPGNDALPRNGPTAGLGDGRPVVTSGRLDSYPLAAFG